MGSEERKGQSGGACGEMTVRRESPRVRLGFGGKCLNVISIWLSENVPLGECCH